MRWGSIDTKQFEELQKRVEELQKTDMDAFCRNIAKELASRLLQMVKKETPVGVYDNTVNFTTKDGKNVSFKVKQKKTGGELRRKWQTDNNVVHRGGEYRIHIYNATKYAIYVEYGHRTPNHQGWVEGRFMMTKSVLKMESKVEAIIAKRLKEVLGEKLNGK